MNRMALLRDGRTAEAAGPELWLVICALLGLLCWWFSHRDIPSLDGTADLAIGHGLPLLDEVIAATHGLTLLRDVADPLQVVARGVAPVAVDADQDGVRIHYRAEARGDVQALVDSLRQRWPEARVLVSVDAVHPQRLLPSLVAAFLMNLGALLAWYRLSRLRAGGWWRWLALQDVLSPDLLLSLLGRQALKVMLVGLVALSAGVGMQAVGVLVLPMALLALSGTGLGLLSAAGGRLHGMVLLGLAQLTLLPALLAPLSAEQIIPIDRWWMSALLALGLVLLSMIVMRRRLMFWCRGGVPS